MAIDWQISNKNRLFGEPQYSFGALRVLDEIVRNGEHTDSRQSHLCGLEVGGVIRASVLVDLEEGIG